MKMVNLNPDDDVWEIGFGDYCANKKNRFTDSGLAALDAHKEELYDQATKVLKLWLDDNETTMMNFDGAMMKLESILNQIEKEK